MNDDFEKIFNIRVFKEDLTLCAFFISGFEILKRSTIQHVNGFFFDTNTKNHEDYFKKKVQVGFAKFL